MEMFKVGDIVSLNGESYLADDKSGVPENFKAGHPFRITSHNTKYLYYTFVELEDLYAKRQFSFSCGASMDYFQLAQKEPKPRLTLKDLLAEGLVE